MKGFSLFISTVIHLGGGLLLSFGVVRPAEFMSALPAPSVAVSLVSSQMPAPVEAPMLPSPQPETAVLPKLPKLQESERIKPIEKKPPPKKISKPKTEVAVTTPPTVVPHAVSSTSTAPTTVESQGSAENSTLVRAHPDYLRNPPPVYPEECRRRGEEGLVILSVAIAADGSPSDVQIKESSKCERLDQAAFKAVSKWRFKPATLAGLPVASRVDVPIRFSLREK